MAQQLKNLLAMQETWIQSLGREDPLVEGLAIPSSVLAGKIPRTEDPGSSWGPKVLDTTEETEPILMKVMH